jgi:hypothetical protein
MKLDFEDIDSWHTRAKVFGGWLVKVNEPVFHLPNGVSDGGDGWDWRVVMAFVPDPKHEWSIEG